MSGDYTFTFDPCILRNDTHFEYLLLYLRADGSTGWDRGIIKPVVHENPEDNIHLVLDYKPQFVKDNWLRIEIAVPNRNAFGNIVAGYIQDTVFFVAERRSSMKIRTNELTGPALDWAVAKCEIGKPIGSFLDGVVAHPSYNNFHPSTDWAQGGPIIEREGIYLRANDTATEWKAGALSINRYDEKPGYLYTGPTPLIAAMRCYVASKLGDEVEIPEELNATPS